MKLTRLAWRGAQAVNDDGGNDAPTDAASADANNARYMDAKEDSL